MARKGSVSKIFVWGLMGLLFVGLAGFGATNIGGNVRTIGQVGDKPIDVDTYARALQNQLARVQQQTGTRLSFREADEFGLTQNVLAQLVTSRALDHEAYVQGLSVGDERLAQELRSNPRFQGPDGSFDREAYRFTLEQSRISESEFEESLREDTTRTILQAAIIAGNGLPDAYATTLLAYAGERRSFTWLALDQDDYDGEPLAPTDADLRTYYDENIADFTRPESRAITYVSIAPEDLADEIEIDESVLREAYDARKAEFILPERRLVEQLVFSDEAAATAALDRITAGEITFEDAVDERGLALSDVDLGDVDADALGAAAEGVFAANVGDVVGPLPAAFGPALFRVNAVLPAQNTSFEDAVDDLRPALVQDRARREIGTLSQDVDDLLAGGATLEEVAQETPLTLGQIEWNPTVSDGIAAYDSFRTAAEVVTEDDFPIVDELDDGGIFAIRLNEVLPPAPNPFEEVRDQVLEAWEARELGQRLAAQADALQEALADGQSLTDLGYEPTVEDGLTRTDFAQGLPPVVLSAAFEMQEGEARVVELPAGAALVTLDAITAADLEADDNQVFVEQLNAEAGTAIADDLLRALAIDAQRRAGIRIDQNALNAVHAQFQ